MVAGDAQLSDMVGTIDEAAERGARLVQRLLAFARNQPLRAEPVDLNEAVAQTAAVLERTIRADIAIKTILADDLRLALADASQLKEAILNLAINARDAMPKGGRLIIETANAHLDEDYAARHAEVSPGDYVAVSVSDNGTGMAAEVAERAFDPFYTTKEADIGTGLGLSMVYGFVKQSNGHVKIYSELGHGTCVKIYLPLSTAAETAEVARTGTAGRATGLETILVVEDDAAVRAVAVTALESFGYTVLQAADGPAAMEIVRARDNVDLLFTDMIMPEGMTGADLARQALQCRPGLKVLYASGYSEHFIGGRDELDGTIALLNKPYRKQGLATAVRDALDRRP
jgi:CheY-like chemotaxis protein